MVADALAFQFEPQPGLLMLQDDFSTANGVTSF